MFFVEKRSNVKPAHIDIKVNVSSIEIGCAGFPDLCFWVEPFDFKPNCLTYAFALSSIFDKEQIEMIELCFFVNYDDSTTNHFTVNHSFICDGTLCIQRTVNIFFRKNRCIRFTEPILETLLKSFLSVCFILFQVVSCDGNEFNVHIAPL